MAKKTRTRKEKVFSLLGLVLIIGGLAFALYPKISNYFVNRENKKHILAYEENISNMDESNFQAMVGYAKTFNQNHMTNEIKDVFSEDEDQAFQEYSSFWALGDSEIIGYIEIPAIDVYLGIYPQADYDSLTKGVGHVQGTSLPVGGAGSHSVLAGHRGWSSAKIFTDLDQLKPGDKFYIHIFGETLAYQIDQNKVVEPYDTSLVQIEEGKDLVTLLTCTPYAVNTHRMCVRGKRIPHISSPDTSALARENKKAFTKSNFSKETDLAYGIGEKIETNVNLAELNKKKIAFIVGFLIFIIVLIILRRRGRHDEEK